MRQWAWSTATTEAEAVIREKLKRIAKARPRERGGRDPKKP